MIVIIGIIVAANLSFRESKDHDKDNYSSVEVKAKDGDSKETIILFDLPEITTKIKNNNNTFSNLKMKLNIEISNASDIKRIEALMPRILDNIMTLTTSVSTEDIDEAREVYFLKEELLYRINLIVDPIKVHSINIKNMEILK